MIHSTLPFPPCFVPRSPPSLIPLLHFNLKYLPFATFESSYLSPEQKRQEEAPLRSLLYHPKQALHDKVQNGTKKSLDNVKRAEVLLVLIKDESK
mmetsp:Transcript_4058/g.6161  ORF Transcript_4058/g.6161 Transcript_4058/m.6161 type:complete len:95 (-) Transcript_4058:1219-1503(-)